MIEKFQRQVQVGLWVLIAVLGLSAVWLAQSVDQMHRSGNVSDTITVSGTGKVTAKPDIAVADLAITVEAPTAAAAQEQSSTKSDTVADYLENAGIDEKDIRTSGYNIFPQYDYTDGRTRIRGYQVTQTLAVKIRKLDDAEKILDGVVKAGVNQVNNFRFDIDDPDALKTDAREQAIADAHDKAEELKSQLGLRLGRVVSFSEDNGNGYPVPYYDKRVMSSAVGGMGGGGMGGDTPAVAELALPQGENEITVHVSITYQIK